MSLALTLLCAVLVSQSTSPSKVKAAQDAAQKKQVAATPAAAASPLDPFKGVKGIWSAGLDADGRADCTVQYRVIAAGSAVNQTLFKGSEHEVVTVYHMDGDRLLCTL